MSIFHSDNLIFDALQTNVDNSTTVTSRAITLSGVQSVSVQVQCNGGAAGTIYIDGCNQPVPSSSNQLPANSPVNWLNFTSQVLTADQQAVLAYSLIDQITTMHSMRVRFVPTAAGAVKVSVNTRRITD